MKAGRATLSWTVLLVLLSAALPVSYARAADEADIVQKLQTAKTPADQEAIASYYDAQAAAAKKKAAEHRRMGESYKGMGTALGKGSGASAMPQHCDSLAKSFEQEAAQYEAMAKVHRDLAKSTK